MQTRENLQEEADTIMLQLGNINIQLSETLPRGRYTDLLKQKRTLGVRHQELLIALRKMNKERKEVLSEAFMTTVLEMFDPQDVSEVWDRLYLNYPHLKQ